MFAEHDGNHHRLRPGEMMALSVDRGGRIASTGNGAYTAVIVPRATLMPLVRAPLRFGCVISCRRSYALAYVDFVIANLDSAPDDERQLTERHLVEVMALALGATRAAEAEAAGSGLKAARLAAIITDIEAHFADPALDLDATAARAGLSARHLQTLLAEDGKTFSTEVKRRRLNRAMALLRDPGRAALRVIDIAQDCGFADVSHFNRSFRAHFGDTPNGMRIRH